ncbi:MAG: hypothetical protein JO177_04715 [Candidatus Eremiobacteraeota bacterium]|nr:hypothetical protein [Candidatus Eremiobacteraeota bacterium]
MPLTITGHRRRYLQLALGSHANAFAVCNGFGSVDGIPVEEAALRELQTTLQRRSRGARFAYQIAKPKAMAAFLIAVVSHLNAYLFKRSAAHEDYVTSGASLTLILVCKDRAYLAHVGTTAAYVVRSGYVVALTKDDSWAFDDDQPARILTRALGIGSQMQMSVCSFRVAGGDTLVLASKRLAGIEDRRALARWIMHGDGTGVLSLSKGNEHTVAAVPIRIAQVAPAIVLPAHRTPLWYLMMALLLSLLLILSV